MAVCQQLGYAHGFMRGEHERAAMYFRRATEAKPRSELSSLGLFHSLVELGRWDDALAESVRLLQLRDSRDYRERFLTPGYGEELSDRCRELLAEARRLLCQHRPDAKA